MEYFTDGSHRFWYGGEPVVQICFSPANGKYHMVRMHYNVSIASFDHYPTVFECAEVWEKYHVAAC